MAATTSETLPQTTFGAPGAHRVALTPTRSTTAASRTSLRALIQRDLVVLWKHKVEFTVRTLADIEHGVRKAARALTPCWKTSWPGHRAASTPSWRAANPRSWWSSCAAKALDLDTTLSPPTLCPGSPPRNCSQMMRRRIIWTRERRRETWDDWDSRDARGDWDGLDSRGDWPDEG